MTAVFPAPREHRFSSLADIEVARELKVVESRHEVVNGLGEFFFRIEADPGTGVIDMFAGPSEDELAVFPTRVLPLGHSASAFTFTMFQQPGTSDEPFESEYRSLLREFEDLERELAA